MALVLVAEIAQRREHGVGRRLAKAAERRIAHGEGELLEGVKVLLVGLAARDGKSRMRSICERPFAAGRALAAGLARGEAHEVARDVHHAVVLVHDDHAARAHDGAELGEGSS